MPYLISVDHESQVINVKLMGEITLEEIFAYIAELMEEPYESLPYGVLTDYRQASLETLSSRDAIKISQSLIDEKDRIPPFHLAILTARPLEYGLNRAFEEFNNLTDMPVKVLVTMDENEAKQWALNSPKPPL